MSRRRNRNRTPAQAPFKDGLNPAIHPLAISDQIAVSDPVLFEVADDGSAKRLNTSTRTIAAKPYDGDAEFVGISNPTYVPFDLTGPLDPQGRPFEITAQLYEVSKDGSSYRLAKYANKEQLAKRLTEARADWDKMERSGDVLEVRGHLREADEVRRERALEALTEAGGGEFEYGDVPGLNAGASDSQSWGNTTYGGGVDLNSSYIPLMGGPSAKQLYLYQYLDMHRKAFEAYNHNPIAHQLIEIQTSFTLGRGVDHVATNAKADLVWREFCERTNFYQDLENIANDFWWQGETMFELHKDSPKKGRLDYRMVDPSTVWEIVTNPEDIQEVYYYHQQYQTQYQQYVDNKVPTIKYILRQIPPDDLLHFKLNVSKYEKRGRTDLFSILGWLKRLKDLMNARVIKGQLEAAFVWDVTVNSGDADVAATSLSLPDPYKPGSTFVHNKNLTLAPLGSQIKAGESSADIAALLNIIAVGFGIPKEFIGELARGGKSGALVATEPGTKRFERRQRLIENICHAMADEVFKCAIKGGILSEDDFLMDARSITKLGQQISDEPTREDALKKAQDAQDEAEQKMEANQAQQVQMQQDQMDQQGAQQHELALNDQKNQHRQALAQIKSNPSKTTHTITTKGKSKESQSLRASDSKSISKKDLSDEQQDRMETIKQTKKYSREILEFMFPAIAQEDRSAKLKDLALSEAMGWISKATAGMMAAKELNITTYNWEEAWDDISKEAELGLPIAHVYSQDNKKVPETVMAQDVQAQLVAEQPVPPAQEFTNVPVPPPVQGDKLVPAQPPGGGGAPGSKPAAPQSGATKVNQAAQPAKTDPTAASHGYSAAANNPMTAEGKGKISAMAKGKKRETAVALKRAIYDDLLREALGPTMNNVAKIARTLTSANMDAQAIIDADESE